MHNCKNEIMNENNGLRTIDFFMLGFGSMIGVGWTVALSDWLNAAGGVLGVVVAFFIGSIMLVPIGLCYGEMTGALPVSGGAMAFAYRAEGSKLSFLGGWLTSLAYIVLLPWEIIYINHILNILFPMLKSGTPLYEVSGIPIYIGSLTVGILLTLLMMFINIKGAETSGKLQTKLSVSIVIIAFIAVVFLLINSDFSHLTPVYIQIEGKAHKSFIDGVIGMLVIVPFFMAGFDVIPQAIEEAGDGIDHKIVSRIISLTIISAGIFYMVIVFASGLVMPLTDFVELDSPNLAFVFRQIYNNKLGLFLYYLTIIGALAGLLSTYNGMFIASTRLLFSMGRSKLIPEIFSKKSEKGTPIVAIIFCSIASLLGPFLGRGVISPLTNVGSLSFVLGWIITCYSTLALRKYEKDLHRPIRAGEGRLIIKIAIFVSSALALLLVVPGSPGFMSYESLGIFIVWIIIGIIFYVISHHTGETISEKERTELIFSNLDEDNIN